MGIRAAACLAALAGGAGLALVAAASSWPPGHSPPAEVVAADAALVLSGDVDYLRAARAAALYRARAVPLLVVTGAGVGGDNAEALRDECVRLGVPRDRILLEAASTSTRENMLFVAPLLRARGLRRVALVTSDLHMGRAERAARRVLPEVDWVMVPVEDAGASSPRRARLQEWAKLLFYLARGWA